MTYRHVLLDFDHTLLDTDTSLELAFGDAMVAAGTSVGAITGSYRLFGEINAALWRQVERGELSPDQVHIERFVRLGERLGLDADPQVMADAFAGGMGAHGELYPGALDLLERLADASITMAMITNGLSAIQRARIERLGIGRFFDAVIISAEAGVAKPDPAIFDLAFGALGDPPRDRALMVGDSLSSDIAGGRAAGVDTCWYNRHGATTGGQPGASPTHTVTDLAAIAAIATGSTDT